MLTNCLNVFDHFVGLALKGLLELTPTQNVFVSKLDFAHKLEFAQLCTYISLVWSAEAKKKFFGDIPDGMTNSKVQNFSKIRIVRKSSKHIYLDLWSEKLFSSPIFLKINCETSLYILSMAYTIFEKYMINVFSN